MQLAVVSLLVSNTLPNESSFYNAPWGNADSKCLITWIILSVNFFSDKLMDFN